MPAGNEIHPGADAQAFRRHEHRVQSRFNMLLFFDCIDLAGPLFNHGDDVVNHLGIGHLV